MAELEEPEGFSVYLDRGLNRWIVIEPAVARRITLPKGTTKQEAYDEARRLSREKHGGT